MNLPPCLQSGGVQQPKRQMHSCCVRKTPLYDNCRLLAPDGSLLSVVDHKKIQWYLGRHLGSEKGWTLSLRQKKVFWFHRSENTHKYGSKICPLHKALNSVDSSGLILVDCIVYCREELNFLFSRFPEPEACYNVGCKMGQLHSNSTILIVILYDIPLCSTCFWDSTHFTTDLWTGRQAWQGPWILSGPEREHLCSVWLQYGLHSQEHCATGI